MGFWDRLTAALLFCLAMTSAADAGETISVFVSIEPQRYFVQQISKASATVQVMVQPGASPATYEPKARQMAELSRADIYFAIGVPFERVWLPKIAAANPKMKIVHTDEGIKKLTMRASHHHDGHGEHHHAHEDEKSPAEHSEAGGKDPHIWLSPPLVKVQAGTILRTLQAADPAHRDRYESNHRAFLDRIDALDDELKQTFQGKKGLQFMVFHPSWGYFARAYGLEQVPIEIEGKDPKPAQLQALIRHARKEQIQVIFVQPQFSTKSAALIAKAIDGRVAFADPLASDWLANLKEVARQFRSALR